MNDKKRIRPDNPFCDTCFDEGWVCEEHIDKAWDYGDGCCGASGMPCHCNKAMPPWSFYPGMNQ